VSGSVIKSVLYFLVYISTSIMYGSLYYSVDGVYVVMISVIFRRLKPACWSDRSLDGSLNKLRQHCSFMTLCS
jgi:hypothetical protein